MPPRAAPPLLPQSYSQRADQLSARTTRLDDVVDVAALGGDVRVGELLGVLRHQLSPPCKWICCRSQLSMKHDVDGALRPHDCDLRRRPGNVEVGPDVLGAHDAVRTAVRLAG